MIYSLSFVQEKHLDSNSDEGKQFADVQVENTAPLRLPGTRPTRSSLFSL